MRSVLFRRLALLGALSPAIALAVDCYVPQNWCQNYPSYTSCSFLKISVAQAVTSCTSTIAPSSLVGTCSWPDNTHTYYESPYSLSIATSYCSSQNAGWSGIWTAGAASVQTFRITTSSSPSAGGSVTCNPNPVSTGGFSMCTATPGSGYSFTRWTGDCSGTGLLCDLFNIDTPKSVTAIFAAPPLFASEVTPTSTSLGVKLTDPHATGFVGDVYFTALLPPSSPIIPKHLQRDTNVGMVPVSFGRSGYKQTGPSIPADVNTTGPISAGNQYTVYDKAAADPLSNSNAVICMGLTIPEVSAKGQVLMRVVATGDKVQGVVQCPTVQTLATTQMYQVQTGGPITARSITATVTPLPEQRGKTLNVYSWAVIPDGRQAMQTPTGWALMDEPMQAAKTLLVPATGPVSLLVTDAYDLSTIVGTLVYVGIGSSWDEVKNMNQAGHYYTIQ